MSLIIGIFFMSFNSEALKTKSKRKNSSRSKITSDNSNYNYSTEDQEPKDSENMDIQSLNTQISASTDARCSDDLDSSYFYQDNSYDCIKKQTYLAHIFFKAGSPDLPMCIFQNETTNFDFLSSEGTGRGISQFVTETWSDMMVTLKKGSEDFDKVNQCVITLSKNTNHPLPDDYNVKKVDIYEKTKKSSKEEKSKKSKKHVFTKEELIADVKSTYENDTLTPYYRDHAICMNQYLLSKKKKVVHNSNNCEKLAKAYNAQPDKKRLDRYAERVCYCVKVALKNASNEIQAANYSAKNYRGNSSAYASQR